MVRAFFNIREKLLFVLFSALILPACGGGKQTGPVDVKWDRDSCERCQMMLSERNFSAQVRVFPEGKRSKVYKFDDMGCAVLWLEKQTYSDDPKTEIWVNNYKTKDWINAKQSWYIKGQTTPMNYGLGAQPDKVDGALDYEQAVKHINLVEKKFNVHGGNLEH